LAQQTKQNIVRMTELHRHLGQVIRKVALSDEHFVVEKGGLPVAVMMSYQEYKELMRERALADHRELVRALSREAERQGLTEEDLLFELKEIRNQVFNERYGDLGG
jgi:prevent-host-death family protein